MAGRQTWDGEIDDLPAEILSYNVKEIPRSTLKDIANRLNADTISAGNWESLAEKLGFTQNSVLDNLTQQAKVQNTYPGLLMLQEWSRRSGSTAHVLLHALREILREDAVGVLVDKLRELHTMQLLVSVQDGEGSPKFLRVPTQKSAPLHASLDNILLKPPYWYDIVGPRYDIHWNTSSGVLQGTQLSLRLRVEPNENSMSEIYGTSATLCQPPPSNPLAMNIPPEHLPFPQGNGPSMNNLSNRQLSDARHDGNISQSPPPLCFPLHTNVSRPLVLQQQSHDSVFYGFEPMTNIGPPQSECMQQFPNFDTLMSSTSEDFQFTDPSVSVSSLLDRADNMEYHPSSCTGLKEPVEPLGVRKHDETLLKERVKPVHEKFSIAVIDKAKSLPEEMNTDAIEHDELALVEGVQFPEISRSPVTASSFMHPVYVTHDRIIQFCNNPSRPQSLHSNSSISSVGGSELQSSDPACVAGQPQKISPNEFRSIENVGEYVPVEFIEQQSQSFEKTSLVSSPNKEEHMQTGYSDLDDVPVEGMDGMEGNGLQQESDPYPKLSDAASTSACSNMDSSKPKPCTYTKYRPGAVISQQHTDFQPRPLPHSVSLDSDHGYLDMRGSHINASHQHPPSTSSAMLAGIHSCMSVDSYMNTHTPDLSLHNMNAGHLLDSTARNMSTPNLDPLLHSRNRNPFPVGGDMFQPRDRRPLTQDHELLLDDPEPEYTYIDATSVSPPADLSRRVSEGALSMTGANGTGRSGILRDSDYGRRHSDVKVDHRGSVCPAELDQIPGWNANITERTVEHEMSRYINDDGNFIVWRYAVGGKYVISVSHLRSIRHYAVYESEREGKEYYYIFPKGARFTTLTGLVLHCQKHGVAEPTKTFKTPDGKQTHRSSRSSGRFSHVRLKFPIPAQRN